MKPILFNTEMVKAILEGRKTVTRRLIKPKFKGVYYPIWKHPEKLIFENSSMDGWWQIWTEKVGSPYTCTKAPYQVGDILYVRETWIESSFGYAYRASDYSTIEEWAGEEIKWKPSIFMPKEAARIFLKVTNVRVERLQDITSDDAISEGVSRDRAFELNNWTPTFYDPDSGGDPDYIEAFKELWNSTVDKTVKDRYGWEANPWVWVIEFEKIQTMSTVQDTRQYENNQ